MATTVTMPQLGESVVEGTIGKWLVQEGDHVDVDQPVVEVLTDKADSEVPSPVAGVVTKLLVGEDDVVEIGAALCEVDPNATAKPKDDQPKDDTKSKDDAKAKAKDDAKAEKAEPAPEAGKAEERRASPPPAAQVAASPSARKLAREKGIDLNELSGNGSITRTDVERAAQGGSSLASSSAGNKKPAPAPAQQPGAMAKKSAFQVPPYVERPGDEVVPFSRRRRIIADHMVYSKLTSPHVVTVAETDLHETAKVRDGAKGAAKKDGINLTYLAFVCAATVRALREYRELNARVLEDAYVLLKDINLGVAVDTPQGLVVPVIKHADSFTVRGLARAIDEIAEKARTGNLTPDDLSSKTFTVSNPGRKGNLHGGAIISQPNVGILRIGEIKKRVVVEERDGQDIMAIHPVMFMSLSYDHRIVDGVNANGFLYRISELLEQGDFQV